MANKAEGAGWCKGWNVKLPWAKFRERYTKTLQQCDMKVMQESIDNYKRHRSKYACACSCFGIKESAGISGCQAELEQLALAIAAQNIMEMICSDMVDDKTKLRSEIVKKLAALHKVGGDQREVGLEKSLPLQLRQKIDKALLWKSVK